MCIVALFLRVAALGVRLEAQRQELALSPLLDPAGELAREAPAAFALDISGALVVGIAVAPPLRSLRNRIPEFGKSRSAISPFSFVASRLLSDLLSARALSDDGAGSTFHPAQSASA